MCLKLAAPEDTPSGLLPGAGLGLRVVGPESCWWLRPARQDMRPHLFEPAWLIRGLVLQLPWQSLDVEAGLGPCVLVQGATAGLAGSSPAGRLPLCAAVLQHSCHVQPRPELCHPPLAEGQKAE